MDNNFLLLTDFYPNTFKNILLNKLDNYKITSEWPVLKYSNKKNEDKKFSTGLIFQQAHISIPSFQNALQNERIKLKDILNDVDLFCNFILNLSKKVSNLFIFTFDLQDIYKKFSILDYHKDIGLKKIILEMNYKLINELSSIHSIYIIDTNIIIKNNDFSQLKSWYTSKQLYSIDQLSLVSDLVNSSLKLLDNTNKKLIICDLDNTLWGGVIGDDGIENLKIGGHDPIGEAFVDFQKYIKSLKNKGILLAVSSKNSLNIALDVFKNHPEMILKEDDFVSIKINWNEKFQNIKNISKELGIGLGDIVFIDDNPIEREKIHQVLPEVLTINLPKSPLNYVEYLSTLDCFDISFFSEEDRKRTDLYKIKKHRENLQNEIRSSKNINFKSQIYIEKFHLNNHLRITQLLNKTNQFNLRTRRLSSVKLLEWINFKNNHLWSYRVSDKFGDHGLTGIASIRIDNKNIYVEDFILSCRVLGYGIENAILSHLVKESKKLCKTKLVLELNKTKKNYPIEKFLKESSLNQISDKCYEWNLNKKLPFPNLIRVKN